MIYLQHGPKWQSQSDELLRKQLIKGIIWDPREEKIEKINEIREKNKLYDNVENFVDLKWFYKQFPDPFMKKLEGLSYFPNELIDRNYLRDTKKVKEKINKMIEFEKMANVDYFISPSLYLSSFNDRMVDQLWNIDDMFYEQIKDYNKEAIISLMLHESAFDNDMYMRDFINDISNYIGKYSTIYIVIDREKLSNIRNAFDEIRLKEVLKFIYSLKKMKFKIIMGYSGIESINYMAIGADIIATGWFYSLRKFNRLEKGLEDYENMGRAKKRYFSFKLLQELPIDDNIQNIPESIKENLYDIILNGNNELDKIIKKENYAMIPMKATYTQYFETMNYINNKFEKIENIEDRLDILEKMLESSKENIKIYNQKAEASPITSRHVEQYLKAIKAFRQENYI